MNFVNSDGNMTTAVIMFGNTCDPQECVLAQVSDRVLEIFPPHPRTSSPADTPNSCWKECKDAKETCYLGQQGEGCWLCVLALQIIIQKMAQLSSPACFREETLNLLSVCQSAHLQDLLASSVRPSNAVSFDDLL